MQHSCPLGCGPLEPHTTRAGLLWTCKVCHGRAVTMPVLRQIIPPAAARRLWRDLSEQPKAGARLCPVCQKSMHSLLLPNQQITLEIDACRSCHLFWFDAHELEQAPALQKQGTPEVRLNSEQREKLALAKIDHIRRQAHADHDEGALPEEPWQAAAALLGLPIEQDNKVSAFPWITAAMALACVIAFALSLALGFQEVVRHWGFLPAEPLRHGGLTWITSFFLHGGWMHLVSNLYFLWVFGDNVEQCLGRVRYLLLLVLAAAVGDLSHYCLEPRSMVPAIGASGGLSGVIVYYALRFPQARLGLMTSLGLYLRVYSFPAIGLLIVWLLVQCFLAWQQSMGRGDVSAFAHLGGALVGLSFWALRKV